MDYHNRRKWKKKRNREKMVKKKNNMKRNKRMTEERRASHNARQRTGTSFFGRFIQWVLNRGEEE